MPWTVDNWVGLSSNFTMIFKIHQLAQDSLKVQKDFVAVKGLNVGLHFQKIPEDLRFTQTSKCV